MSKRYTDTNKWFKSWFRGLPSEYKLAWLYLVDMCNHAGIWDVELDVLNVRLGTQISLAGIKNHFGDKVEILVNDKIYLTSFVEYQYGLPLNPDNIAHDSVLMLLHKAGASIAPNLAPAVAPVSGRAGKEKEERKEKERSKEKEKKEVKEILVNNITNSKSKSNLISTKHKDKSNINIYNIIYIKDEEFEHLKDKEFKDAFLQFLIFRKKIRKTATEHAQMLMMRKLQKEDIPTAIAMLEQSILSGWMGIFPLKKDQISTQYQRKGVQQAPDAIKSQLPISRGGLIPDDEYKKLTGGSNG